jgi:hypothetical protein
LCQCFFLPCRQCLFSLISFCWCYCHAVMTVCIAPKLSLKLSLIWRLLSFAWSRSLNISRNCRIDILFVAIALSDIKISQVSSRKINACRRRLLLIVNTDY